MQLSDDSVDFDALDLHVLGISDDMLQRVISQASAANVMAALSPRRFFAAWRGRGPLFRGFPFRWTLQFLFSLVCCLTLRDAAPFSRKDSLYECSRPCDTLSCFFTALWLGQSQSVLTKVQQTNDIDWTCYKTLPTKSVKCSQSVPMSLEWPVVPIAGSDPSSNDEHLEGALPALPDSRLGRDALQPPQIQRVTLDRNTCVHILDDGIRRVSWNTGRLIGSVTSLLQVSRRQKQKLFQPTYRKQQHQMPSRSTWER